MNKNFKNGLVAAFLIAVLTGAAFLAYHYTRPEASAGEKTVTLTVSADGREDKSFEITTKAGYLYDLLKEENIAEFKESTFGYWITSVDGIEADEAKNQYWSIYINGEFGELGVSVQPVSNGDVIKLILAAF